MRRFKANTGTIYTGNVINQVGDKVLMDNYIVLYEDGSEPINNRHPDDSIVFTAECELS